jgi:hypothetical protein
MRIEGMPLEADAGFEAEAPQESSACECAKEVGW